MTVGLCVITQTYTEALAKTLDALVDHVDLIYVQVNGGKAPGSSDKIKFSTFKWNDNFADARNALLSEVTTDYWLWMDSDDVIFQPENIRTVVERMEAKGLDIVFADYIYARNAEGLPIEVQRRERFLRTGLSGEWRGTPRVHETFIPNGSCETENTNLVTWIHHDYNHEKSAVRNERLLQLDWDDTHDPRAAHYMGLNQAGQGKYKEAIPWFEKLIETGGWDEERYRAWLQIATCYQQLKDFDAAADAYQKATLELPEWPDAYYGLQQIYYEIDDHEKSIAWFEIGRKLKRPDTDSAYNPIVVEYQPLLLAGLSYLFIGQIKNAVQAAGALKKLAPNYGELKKLEPEIIRAYNEEQAVEAVKTLTKYADKYDGDPQDILKVLPTSLKADIRLTEERRKYIPGREWPKGSIVFYCGRSYEPWGPETLDRGMGGSEEAVVYLSRELSMFNDGADVTIYNERQSPYDDQEGTAFNVEYLPWTEINPNDTFDVFIAERDPTVLSNITARVKICDMHDTINPQLVYNSAEFVDKYIFRSKWHRNLYPELPDNKCAIIGNGIKESYA